MAAKKKNTMKRTPGGSPIIDVSIRSNKSGPDGSFYRKRPTAQVQGKNGITYMVPIDPETGRVPEDVLYEHFLDYTSWSTTGKERSPKLDSRTPAKKIHVPKDEKGFTPEEIVESGWWAAVNGSDVMGVDDGTSSILKDWKDIKASAKPHLGKVAIIAPEEVQDRIVKTLQDNFTVGELKRMTDKTGLVISMGNPGPGNDGVYYPRQPGVDTPNIIVRRDSGEDTITHEVVHHARYTDQARKGIARTPYPFDKDERLLPISGPMDASMTNLEEASTVAETTSRTRGPTTNLGYYTYLEGNARELYDQDRDTLTHGKPLRGKRAVDKFSESFEDTNISNLQYKRNGRKAKTSVEKGREEGKYPPRKTAGEKASASKAKSASSGSTKASPMSTGSKKASTTKKTGSSKQKSTANKGTSSKGRGSSAKNGGRR